MLMATCLEENVSTMQPTTHFYELSEPYEGHRHVLVSVSTLPHCADDSFVIAASSNGAAVPDSDSGSYCILARLDDNTSHVEALRHIGYQIDSEPMEAL